MMTDPKNENNVDTSGLNEATQAAPKPTLRAAPIPPKKPESKPMPSFEELAERAPAKKPPIAPAKPAPAAAKPAPAAAKVALAPKPAAAPMSTPDPSVSIDDDSDTGAPVALLIVDAFAAAVAIAFTVLLVQDTLPFLK